MNLHEFNKNKKEIIEKNKQTKKEEIVPIIFLKKLISKPWLEIGIQSLKKKFIIK